MLKHPFLDSTDATANPDDSYASPGRDQSTNYHPNADTDNRTTATNSGRPAIRRATCVPSAN